MANELHKIDASVARMLREGQAVEVTAPLSLELNGTEAGSLIEVTLRDGSMIRVVVVKAKQSRGIMPAYPLRWDLTVRGVM